MRYFKTFCLRGLIAMGFGPIILVFIYLGLDQANIVHSIPIPTLNLAIISSLLIGFIEGGIGVVYQIERLSLGKATLIQSLVIYVSLLFFYYINAWIPRNWSGFSIFSIIYWIAYGIIWLIIYQSVLRHVRKVNSKL